MFVYGSNVAPSSCSKSQLSISTVICPSMTTPEANSILLYKACELHFNVKP